MNSTITEEMEKAITSKEKHLEEKMEKSVKLCSRQLTPIITCTNKWQMRVRVCVFVQVRACACVCVNLSSLGETTSCKTDSDVDV